MLQRRVTKLAALLRLALVLGPRLGRRLIGEWPLDGPDRARLLRAVEGARTSIPLRGILRFLHLSPGRFHAWRRRQRACALNDQRSCPRASPHRLTRGEVHAIEDMVTSPAYRHVPARTLAVLAQRLGTLCASPSTWYRLVRTYGWRRPRLRVHPAKPKVGLRTIGPNEVWHIDTTVIRLLDGSRAYLHAVIDTSPGGSWRGTSPMRSHQPTAWPSSSPQLRGQRPQSTPHSCWRTRVWRMSTRRSTHCSPRVCCGACWRRWCMALGPTARVGPRRPVGWRFRGALSHGSRVR